MFKVIISSNINDDCKLVFSSDLLTLDQSTDLFSKTRNIYCSEKNISVQQIEILENKNVKIINEHKTDSDGKDLLFSSSTVKEEIDKIKIERKKQPIGKPTGCFYLNEKEPYWLFFGTCSL